MKLIRAVHDLMSTRSHRVVAPAIACLTLFTGSLFTGAAVAQEPASDSPQVSDALVRQLLRRLAEAEARIGELEQQKANSVVHAAYEPAVTRGVRIVPAVAVTAPASTPVTGGDMPHMNDMAQPSGAGEAEHVEAAPAAAETLAAAMPSMDNDPHDHMINLPGGGPTLKIRGYSDFNFDTGVNGNPLIYPLGGTAHNTFQIGEFDLFMSSKLSDHLSFVGEVVIGSDATNVWGVDIERLQLTYRANRYFEISGGRYHTAIGYYNTMFHHGTWFQTATGRPFMYYFEDSGGLLPVHNVGATATGLVPGTGKLGLHWIAEVGNGRAATQSASVEPVQNFLSERNHKSTNFAAYIRPEWLEGLQVGGGVYMDKLFPNGVTGVSQTIRSLYAVYNNANWEFLNEGVWLQDRSDFDHRTYNTPLMYSQISRRFGEYRPFVRYQYVNSVEGDPLSAFHGRYQGPSVGIRYNVSPYAALKIQYNRLYQTGVAGVNGINMQLAFAF